MKNSFILISTALLLSTPVYAQEQPAATQVQTTITEAQAIETAKNYAINQIGISPDWFGGKVDITQKENGLIVHFNGKPVDGNNLYLTGDHFSVYLSPSGEVTDFFKGL